MTGMRTNFCFILKRMLIFIYLNFNSINISVYFLILFPSSVCCVLWNGLQVCRCVDICYVWGHDEVRLSTEALWVGRSGTPRTLEWVLGRRGLWVPVQGSRLFEPFDWSKGHALVGFWLDKSPWSLRPVLFIGSFVSMAPPGSECAVLTVLKTLVFMVVTIIVLIKRGRLY